MKLRYRLAPYALLVAALVGIGATSPREEYEVFPTITEGPAQPPGSPCEGGYHVLPGYVHSNFLPGEPVLTRFGDESEVTFFLNQPGFGAAIVNSPPHYVYEGGMAQGTWNPVTSVEGEAFYGASVGIRPVHLGTSGHSNTSEAPGGAAVCSDGSEYYLRPTSSGARK